MHLSFLQVPEKYLRHYSWVNITNNVETVHDVTLGLEFSAQRNDFKNKRRMKLKCVATIYDCYHKVNEISVEKIRRRRLEEETSSSRIQSSE